MKTKIETRHMPEAAISIELTRLEKTICDPALATVALAERIQELRQARRMINEAKPGV